MSFRLLFFSDTHLGYNTRKPKTPLSDNRFFFNYHRVLQSATNQQVDGIVHGGDLLYRSRVSVSLVLDAFAPLFRLADQGLPIFIVPGNHERSRIPHALLTRRPNIHVFDKPHTYTLERSGARLALSGFAYQPNIRKRFPALIEQTGWQQKRADFRLLCLHQALEGATVGPQNYTFRTKTDVARLDHLPDAFSAVLAGHIHRHQILRQNLRGHPLRTPIWYAGSTTPTSSAERGEAKGYMLITLRKRVRPQWKFVPISQSGRF